MKLLICSDIHGDLDGINAVLKAYKTEKADKILILGDILYHGPRNDLPSAYAPKDVIKVLNENKSIIMATRGNCDTEVDQMVLEFPILSDYICLSLDGLTVFATHGHKYNIKTPLPMNRYDILLHGHTHIPAFTEFGEENLYINPGSTSIPKENNPKTYMIYENRTFTLKTLSGEVVSKKTL